LTSVPESGTLLSVAGISPGERVAHWRGIKGLSLRQLAKASGLHVSSLHRIEHEQQEVKASEVEAIAKALGLNVSDFYGEATGGQARRRGPTS
jgi:transcriptional regulator with XRE-family HTH domain